MRSHHCVHSEEGRPAPRFPLIALLAPLVVSAVLFIVLRSSYVLVFALLGPVMALSSWWEARRTHRVENERQREEARARDEEDYRSRAVLRFRERLSASPTRARGTIRRIAEGLAAATCSRQHTPAGGAVGSR